MSLINKMLQDLEQRNDVAARSEPLAGEVRALPGASASRLGRMAGLLLLLLLAAGAAAWMLMQPKAAPPVVAVAPAAAPVVVPAPSVAATAAVPAPTPMAAPVAAPPGQSANKSQPVSRAAPQPTASGKRAAEADVPRPARVAAETSASAPPQAVTKKPSKVVVEEAVPAVEKTPLVAAPAPENRFPKRVSPEQQSDNLYKQAIAQLQQGRGSEVRQSLRRALEANPNNARARQMLAGLLVESNQLEEASVLLREGLKLSPEQSSFSMALARLQLEGGDTAGAMATLEQGLASAGDEPNYHAFYAALLQRTQRHDAAVRHYVMALRSDPAMPSWLVGIGISLQALGKNADAAEAFQRARDGGQLTPQMSQFVEQRLSQLRR